MSEYGAETKVGDFEVTVSCEKEVFGFKVAVGDTFGVDEFLTEHSFNLVADVGALLGSLPRQQPSGQSKTWQDLRAHQRPALIATVSFVNPGKAVHIPILSNKSPPTASSRSMYSPGV